MGQAMVTLARDLHRRRGRERRGLTLAEGIRLVEEALAAAVPIRGAVGTAALEATPRGAALATSIRARGVSLETVDEATFASVSDTEHPQGIVAIVACPSWTLADLCWRDGSTMLLLDGVQDPGNAGTILRTAFALGADGVVALPGTVDLSNPKVMRGAMGASFRLPHVAADRDSCLAWIEGGGAELWVADAAGTPVPRGDRPPRLALAVGNEGAGGGAILRHHAARTVAIPLRAGAESLNVAVATALLLHEVTRVD